MGRHEKWKGAFSTMAGSEASQDAFVDSLADMSGKMGFDGVDLNWEYPADPSTGGASEDFDNLVTVCRKLRKRLKAAGKDGPSVTLPATYKLLRGFNVRALQEHVEWFNFMAYDFQMDMRLDLLWRNDVEPDKVVLGLAFYGRSFTMSDPECLAAGCEFRDAGRPGRCTRSPGFLSAQEIREIIDRDPSRARVGFDKQAAVKTLAWDTDQWIGTMVWSIDMDDGSLVEALTENRGGGHGHAVDVRFARR
ncbi:Endochitinase [Escovopsis weberi]|uniref:chitinase n=1 Tax=Escovopsis weberi TaxID=150374 RepID=A0A0M8N685_ESCWE|nr:Endochitinase [Escovopsis weberi]